jgi:hypothetical protein
MSTLMERGLDMLARALPETAGGRILYQRGEERIWIEAAFGRSEFQVESADGVRIEHSDRDFIFPAEALILAGTPATPQRGDRISVVRENRLDLQVFEVLAPGGEQVYRQCDSQGIMIRVHTKRVSG